jgi:hypothetical protein
MRIGVMKDSKTKAEESTRLTYTGLRHSCCHTYFGDVIFATFNSDFFLLWGPTLMRAHKEMCKES